MKKLLGVAVVLGLAAVVYAKAIRSSPPERACERLGSLCSAKQLDGKDIGECREAFDEAEKIFGDKVVDKAVDCMDDANTCMEALGCMAGAATHGLEDFEKGFERGKN